MVSKNISVIPTGHKDIPLWDTRNGMAFGIIITAEGYSTNVAQRRFHRCLVKDVIVMTTNKN